MSREKKTIKVQVLKPRNPLFVPALFRRAGRLQQGNERQRARKETLKELHQGG